MRIVVDIRDAGALGDVRSLVASRPRDEIVLAACASDEASMLAIREAVRGLLPPSAVRGFELPPGCDAEDADTLRAAFVASLAPDAVYVGTSDGVQQETIAAAGGEARPSLYYVSPLPPDRTGIAAYSAHFVPYLAAHYDITLVTADGTAALDGFAVRSAEWLVANARRGDRVLYHMGNSAFHAHMGELIARVPGVVVLHDFFLGHLAAHLETEGVHPLSWTRELCRAHGYGAVRDRFADAAAAVWTYPASLSVIQRAQGVVVHSPSSVRLARHWYGDEVARRFDVVAMPRAMPAQQDRMAARRALGISEDVFLVCAFGMLGPSKLNTALVEAWLSSSLASDGKCRLVFVGENPDRAYAEKLARLLAGGRFATLPSITGWVSNADFDHYLAAADVAVQLRTSSRGETSAAALDCMAHGLPTVVNANGSFADLPPDAVVILPDAFEAPALADALEGLHRDEGGRARLSQRAREAIADRHDPARCAAAFRAAIESRVARDRAGYRRAVTRAAQRIGDNEAVAQAWAGALAATFPWPRAPRLFVDVSITCREDLRTGIQRTVRAITLALVRESQPSRMVEPVYASDAGGRWHFRHARKWMSHMMNIPRDALPDEAVDFAAGDVLLSLDLGESLVHEVARSGAYGALRARGVALGFVIYDTLPLAMPEMFPPGRTEFARWFAAVAESADFVACISRAVAADVEARLADARRAPRVGWFHLGADVESSAPTRGRPPGADAVLRRLASRRAFLMVGTLEPRKGHLQAIEAFTELWSRGIDVDLVIVGSEGWRSVPPPMRRTIPAIVERISRHPERDKRLLWIDDASDEYLAELLDHASCLVAASEGEGFGLPLVEAARHRLPIIARDLPVFREVAGEHAFYFAGREPSTLAEAVVAWLALRDADRHPRSSGIAFRTWDQSARDLVACVDALAA